MASSKLPNQVTRRVGFLLLLRENTSTPSDAEWDETLRLMTMNPGDLDRIRVLVVTDGGGPTPVQRKRLSKAMAGKPVRVAVVSESVNVRFIVSSVALFTSKIRSFRLGELEQAFHYLGLNPEERLVARRNISEMHLLISH